jgi:hypothetical protein
MDYKNIIFYANVFVPLDLSFVPRCSLILFVGVSTHVPKFDGNPWLASDHLEYFMKYVVDTNIFYEDILMKAFSYSLQEKVHGIGIVISNLKR